MEGAKARKSDENAPRSRNEVKSKVAALARSETTHKRVPQHMTTTRTCLKCQSPEHMVWRCPKAGPEEAKTLYEEMKAAKKGDIYKKKPISVNGWVGGVIEELRTVPCKIGGEHVEAVLDSGADQSVMCPKLVERLEAAGVWMTCRTLGREVELSGFQEGLRVSIAKEVKVDLDFSTFAGKLLLRNVVCWVAAAPLAAGLGEVLVSRKEMAVMGYSAESILDKARAENADYDMVDGQRVERPAVALLSRLDQPPARPMAEEEKSLIPWEKAVCFPEEEKEAQKKKLAVKEMLMQKVKEAEAEGCSPAFTDELRKLLTRHSDVFRLELGQDPPVDMPPLKVNLRDDARPVRCKARRYGPEQRAFMDKHVEQLEKMGLVYKNTRSRWCSPPLIVRKPEANEFRMTVDVRAVNAQTERMVWPMPMLEVVLDHVAGSSVFFSLDFFKGYWEFMLDPASQEMFSFLTDQGVYTPTRVLMGGTDSVAYCQATVQEMFEDVLYKGLLIWLDDLLGYAASPGALLNLLDKVLCICQARGLKLNPK